MAVRRREVDVRVRLLFLPVLALAWGSVPLEAAALQRSISSSGQFVIYFSDATVRAELARASEDVKEKWRRTLHLKDEWKAPIIIQVADRRPRNAPRLLTRLYESDGGAYKVQIDIYDVTVTKDRSLQREILRALCLEYSYRGHAALAGRPVIQPPNWLIDGLAEDLLANEDGIPAGLYEMLIKSGPPPQLGAFLKMDPDRLDAISRTIYAAQAMGLLRALLSLPGGADGLTAYLSALPEGNSSDAKRLTSAFPEFAEDETKLSKLWTLSLAGASATDRVMPLSMLETRRRLSLLLEISTPRDPKKPELGMVTGVEALPILARAESGRYVMKQKSEDFLRLELRAHPIMRPIIEEYGKITNLLVAKPRKNVEKRLRMNAELHAAVEERSEAIEDYVNWFEATQPGTPSHKFDEAIAIQKVPGLPQRNDAISRQLDRLESQGW